MPKITNKNSGTAGSVSSSQVTTIVTDEWPNLDTDSTDDLTTAINDAVHGVTVSGTSLYASAGIDATHVEITQPGSGIVLAASDGNRWSLSVDTNGNLVVQEV